ncbi:MAG: sulfotransferase family protein [Lysobacteraceae bacterium]|nr:MAG: sulfotransferase family protein [Xanthomonadaceae bacterium]
MNTADHGDWLQAQRHIAAGRWQQASGLLQALLLRHPRAVPIHLLMAGVILAQGRVREATRHLLLGAQFLEPDANVDLVCRLAQSLSKLGESAAARACLQHPAATRSGSGPALLALAHVQQGLGLHPQALALMERARASGLSDPDFLYFHALQLQFNGRLAEAEAGMDACLAAGPTFGRASLTLARLRRQTPQHNHVDALRRRMRGAPAGSEDQAAFEFALHKELDDLGNHAEAWQALQRGNAIMHRRLGYDAIAEEALFEALRQRFEQPLPELPGDDVDGPVPIFIVGMPRSGTTLLERIVGNHSQVTPAGELADLPRQLRWTADTHGHALLDLPLLQASEALDFDLLGRRYLEQTRWRAQGRRYYIDKLPPNFMLVGFIRRALPRARILHMVREPMDVCFSNYRALFGDSYSYSYDLAALAHHHRQYRQLMAHWHAVAPGFVLDIAYDDLVRDTAASARRLLDFCGLEFEPGCLDTAANAAPVSTLSSVQVRAPIHSRGRGEWERYAAQLQPLRSALQG